VCASPDGRPADHERQHENAGQQPPQHLAGRRLLHDGGGDAVFGRGRKQPEREQKAADRAVHRHVGEGERVVIGGNAVGVAGEHDQDLGEDDERQDLAEGRGYAALLGVKQRQAEQDQQSGDTGRHVHLSGLRRSGGNAVAANERLIDAKVETQQVLTEDGQTEHNEGKADQPGERADRPESEAE
jgi:hypothetical protein